MKITTLTPWKGSNRMLAPEVGRHLAGCDHVVIPCAGGMSEIPHIKARTLMVNDVHRHVINLAWTVRDRKQEFAEQLAPACFHPDELKAAQTVCQQIEQFGYQNIVMPDLRWAVAYFLATWMARSGTAGTKTEFKGGLALRWEAGGGDSNVRLRSAIGSLQAWNETMQRCTFSTLCMFDLLPKVHDKAEHGVYIDATFPDAGDDYKFTLARQQHEILPKLLERFTKTKVVMRWYDHPLIRRLYPANDWTWHELRGRDQANNANKPEVILTSKRD